MEFKVGDWVWQHSGLFEELFEILEIHSQTSFTVKFLQDNKPYGAKKGEIIDGWGRYSIYKKVNYMKSPLYKALKGI